MNGTGRCDNGSDDSIASAFVSHATVLKGIDRLEAIEPVTIQVALSSSEQPEHFVFSRTWRVPRLILELSSGLLALTNISFLVSYASLLTEDLLIGLPVLQHLGIDSRILLERNRSALDGTDCFVVKNPTVSKTCGTLGRLMIVRLQRITGRDPTDESETATPPAELYPTRSRENYFASRFDEDPFPDPNLLDLDCPSRDATKRADVLAMIKHSIGNDIPAEFVTSFTELVWEFSSKFSRRFSATPAKVDPLRIELTPDARPA